MTREHRDVAAKDALLNHRHIVWNNVVRTRFRCHQRFTYTYSGPVRDLYQQLVVTPPDSYGDQELLEHSIEVTPAAQRGWETSDAFGNRVWHLALERVERVAEFTTEMTLERTLSDARPLLSADQAANFFAQSALTPIDDRMKAVAHDTAGAATGPEDLAQRLSRWVSSQMRYGSGATTVETPAPDALAAGRGLCQDYAHILIALCREVGLAARYVSGHMLAEGGSHAWVDVLLPEGDDGYRPLALDPTNRRRPDLRYFTVATGRDYRDVTPTSGQFTAPYGGVLTFAKRAGLTLVEHRDGTLLRAVPPGARRGDQAA